MQMNLLDRAVKMAAEQDEPDDMNFVRKHAREQAEERGVTLREAASRIFSNASGSYSSNVNLAVENSSWSDEQQLQEMYLARKSFAFNSDRFAALLPALPCIILVPGEKMGSRRLRMLSLGFSRKPKQLAMRTASSHSARPRVSISAVACPGYSSPSKPVISHYDDNILQHGE